jgi:hypothetical protein
VRGDNFKEGVDFEETDAPVAHSPVVRTILCWAVSKGLLVFSWDVEHAFYVNKMDRAGVIVELFPD